MFNMTFESGVVADDWKLSVTVPLHKDKYEKTQHES